MFLCCECGKIFEEPEWHEEYRGECFGFPSYEEFSTCPECGGVYVETYECDCCEKWITGDYVELDNGSRYCESCYVIRSIDEYN